MLGEEVRPAGPRRPRCDARQIGGGRPVPPQLFDDRPAIIVFDPAGEPRAPFYSCLLRFEDGRVTHIRDYRHARYAVELLQLEPLNIAR